MIRVPFAAAALAALALATTASAAQLTPNNVKYNDRSHKPATGSSGSATLEGRALVNRDHSADLELTTGSFEPAWSRGTIEKVQVQSPSGTVNANHLTNSGTHAMNVRGVGGGQVLDVLANVSGIDGARVDVVSLPVVARLRPDLQVVAIDAAPHTEAGMPMTIDATVRERNGDMGARANCLLRVGGVVVDSASNIWVDAGGTVSCSFVHTFDGAGVQAFEVAVSSQSPADYDPSNDALNGSVTVYEDAGQMPGFGAVVEEYEFVYDYFSEASWGYHFDFHQEGWNGTSSFIGRAEFNLDIDNIRLSYTEKTDDQTIVELRDVPLIRNDAAYMGSGSGRRGVQCVTGLTSLVTVLICQRPEYISTGGPGNFSLSPFFRPRVSRRAGDVTYLGHEWGKPTPDSPDGTYIKNEFTHDVYGSQVRLGSTVTMDVAISDGSEMYTEHVVMPLTVESSGFEDPYVCYNEYWCRSASYTMTTRRGVASR